MSDNEQKEIFQKNLLKYISTSGKMQKEIAEAIGVSPQTFNTWCQGIALPRMGKVQLLADYFHINKSDLIERKSSEEETDTRPIYYLDKEASEAAQFLYENPDYKVLFDATRKVKKEDIDFVKEMIDRLSTRD